MRIPARGPIALVLLLIAATGCNQSDAQSSPPPKDAAKAAPGAIKPLPITVAKAESREVQRSVETVGSLLAWHDAWCSTEQPGTIAACSSTSATRSRGARCWPSTTPASSSSR